MIGRKNEITELNKLYESNKAQLIAVYGRRRVGKTFLVDETFKGRITFRHAGLSPIESSDVSGGSPMKIQLKHFYNSLLMHGMKKSKCPDNWLDAFFMLEMLLQSKDDGKRQLVFLDELPWLDTAKSGFITAFEAFWNTWGCHRDNLIVIVCGSATSWILDKLINNHGGLYNRVTYEIKLSPFTLLECEEYFQNENIKFSRYDIVQCYMITGGLPYYLSYFQKGMSLAQNIDRLFFSKGGKLKGEYDRLFASIFNNPDMMKSIIKLLSTRSAGYTRNVISEKTGYSAGGTLTEALQGLIASDFIIKYVPFGYSKREEHYKLVDPFCIFYLRFVEKEDSLNESFWQQNQVSQSVTSWRGFAFENVCFNHIKQIKAALGISGVSTKHSAWTKRSDDTMGTQIDLIIERKDHVVNLCEIKFYGNDFVQTKESHRNLMNKQQLLEKEISSRMVIHNTLITTYGLKYNEYSGDFDNVITMEALFA